MKYSNNKNKFKKCTMVLLKQTNHRVTTFMKIVSKYNENIELENKQIANKTI